MSIISKERAFKIAKEFANEISLIVGDCILAIFAIGSLGGGYYRPGQSDIDTLILLDDCNDSNCFNIDIIEKKASEYQQKYNIPKEMGAVVIEKNQLYPPYNFVDELVLEIIRLKTQSVLLHGNFDINSIPMPERNSIIQDAIVFEEWWDNDFLPFNSHLSLTQCSNSILIHLKRYLLIEKGIIEFNKLRVIDKYLSYNPTVINKEVFEIINNNINDNEYKEKVTEKELRLMNNFFGELRVTMNKLLLSR